MKVIVNEESKEKELPKLMICKNDENLVVFMFGDKQGVVISCKTRYTGYYSEYWVMTDFKDFNGTVTLQNDQSKQ